jgi:hypothetical protein
VKFLRARRFEWHIHLCTLRFPVLLILKSLRKALVKDRMSVEQALPLKTAEKRSIGTTMQSTVDVVYMQLCLDTLLKGEQTSKE